MKNKNKIILSVLISMFVVLFANAADISLKIDNINQKWENLLEVAFDKELSASWVSWDVKLFRDLEIVKVSVDEKMPNKLNIELNNEVKVWSVYNVFSVFWVDWTADFMVEDNLAVKMLSKAPEAQWILRVAFNDSKNMEIYFKNTLTWKDFEFKLLEENWINDISISTWVLALNASLKIENDSNYIFMIISLSDTQWNNYIIDNSIFDFTIWTSAFIKDANEDLVKTVLSTTVKESIEDSKTEIPTTTIEDTKVELLSGSTNVDATLNTSDVNTSTWNLETMAKTVKETPDTWAETWVLIFLTLIINSFYFLTRRLS